MRESQTEKEEMREQRRINMTTDMTMKIKSKGRMDANNSWWVSDLMAADRKKTWLHPEWEDTVRRWHKWLYEMKKKYEEKRKVFHQQLVSRMIKSADGGTGLLRKNHQANVVKRRSADSEGGRGEEERMGKALAMLCEGARPQGQAVERQRVEEFGGGYAQVVGEGGREGSKEL